MFSRIHISIPLSLTLLILAACSKPANINTATDPAPASQAPILSSAQVVKLSFSRVNITAGGAAEAVITLTINPGYHVNANPATFPYLIATEVQPGKLEGIGTGKPVYPPALTKTFQFAEEPLKVYESQAVITFPLRVSASISKGQHSLPFKLRVQACDNEKCFAPDTIETALLINVTDRVDD